MKKKQSKAEPEISLKPSSRPPVFKNFVDYTPDEWRHVGIEPNFHNGKRSFRLRGRVSIMGWSPGDLAALGLPRQSATERLILAEALKLGGQIEAAMVKLEETKEPVKR